MGFRFRKSVRIAPGVRINATNRGLGASFSIPGTGLSYSTRRRGRRQTSAGCCCGMALLAIPVVLPYALVRVVIARLLTLEAFKRKHGLGR